MSWPIPVAVLGHPNLSQRLGRVTIQGLLSGGKDGQDLGGQGPSPESQGF